MFELQVQYEQLENHYHASVRCGSNNYAYKPVYIGKDVKKDVKYLPTSKQLLAYALKQKGSAKYKDAKITNGFIIGPIFNLNVQCV